MLFQNDSMFIEKYFNVESREEVGKYFMGMQVARIQMEYFAKDNSIFERCFDENDELLYERTSLCSSVQEFRDIINKYFAIQKLR